MDFRQHVPCHSLLDTRHVGQGNTTVEFVAQPSPVQAWPVVRGYPHLRETAALCYTAADSGARIQVRAAGYFGAGARRRGQSHG
jgi:hypothetical protein